MTTDDDEQQSPFTRPGFIAAAVVIALVVVLGIVLVVVNANDDDPGPSPTSSPAATSAAPTPEITEAAGGASVCGLDGEVLSGTLTSAPDATWAYQGVTAFPTSDTYGPGETGAAGVRSCFQHSPSGALFAAANGLVQATDPAQAAIWMDQFLAQGPHREEILAANASTGTQTGDTRLAIAGFRLLQYDGSTSRVEIAVDGSSQGTAIAGSFVYELVWQEGDWKLSADTASPFSYATIPDLSGYIVWKA